MGLTQKKYNCLILDDEPLAGKLMADYVERINQFNLLACCTDVYEAQNYLLNENVDILFLDIEMPQMNGVEFLKMLPKAPFTVFTTAYSNYAVDGYELNIVDFLLKPITYPRFFKTVNKLLGHLQKEQPTEISVEENISSNAEESSTKSDYIFVKADGKLVKINYKDIIYIESMREYVSIYTNEKRIMTLQSLTRLMDILPQQEFIRIQRSFAINLAHVDSVFGNTVVMSNKKELPISKGKKNEFLDRISPDIL